MLSLQGKIKFFEFEAKDILRKYGIITPRGNVANNLEGNNNGQQWGLQNLKSMPLTLLGCL